MKEEEEEEGAMRWDTEANSAQFSSPCDSSQPLRFSTLPRHSFADVYLGVWLVEEGFPHWAGLDGRTFVAATQLLANEFDQSALTPRRPQ